MEIKIIYIKYEKNTAISLKDHQVLKTYFKIYFFWEIHLS